MQPKQEDVEGEPTTEAESKLSKGQLKKLKEKQKKEKLAQEAAQKAQQQGETPAPNNANNTNEPKAAATENKEVAPPALKEEKKDDKKAKKDAKKPTGAALMALKRAEQMRIEQQEIERQRKAFEQQQRRIEEELREKERLEQQEKERKKQQKARLKKELKAKGLYVSGKDKLKLQKMNIARQQFEKMKAADASDSSDEEDQIQPTGGVAAEKPEVAPAVPVQVPVAEPEKKEPKKKYVKKKEKTLEEIYAEALAEKERREKQQLNGPPVENWEELAADKPSSRKPSSRKPSESIKPKDETPVPVEAAPVDQKKEEKKKKKKEKELKEPEPVVQKKKIVESELLKDQKQAFKVQQKDYRSPICCILGHVDTGKTTLLDKIRNTNVQEGEAGGITQQIGATFFPKVKLSEEIDKCKDHFPTDVNVPGLLIIDTPGHQSFANLRSRGSSLCDIAILVIDLMHGLQNQTIESINLLRNKGTPFVIALNKIDRTYNWKTVKDRSSYLALKQQAPQTLSDYKNRLQGIITEINQQGFNTAMYWENEDPTQYVSIVPTSGVTGEGIPDLLSVLVKYSLTMSSIKKRIKVSKTKFSCTVMEVKMIEGHGTTIDCILVDGKLRKDDQIVLLGFNGPIKTKIKALLTPHPMKQMRVKDEYLYHDEMLAANGVKISAPGLDEAVAGTPLFVANTEEEVEDAMEDCEAEYENVKSKMKLSNLGVGVAASTLGSLEALLQYLSKEKVPVSYVSVGPVSKEDVLKAMKSLLSENPERRKKEFCCLLVFDVKILPDAQKYAEENDIRIFSANIIYHLTDHFNKYVKEVKEERKLKEGRDAVFPCVLKQVHVFRKCDPIVLGVDVEQGVLKIGTPLCVYGKDSEKIKLGVVQSIELNHKKLKEARKATGSVAISLGGDPKITSGKDFNPTDKLCSILSRKSIDCLKEHFRDEVSKDEWQLVIELKNFFKIS